METLLPGDADPAMKSLLNIAIRSTERIQRLTNSLLDMRRLEADQPIGNQVKCSPIPIISEAIEIVSLTADNKKQVIVNTVSPDLPEVWVDVDMIRRVVINLLENAVKYTPLDSVIKIGAEQQNGHILVWVQDNGPGIPTNDRERIFEKFIRLHPSDGPKGLGLGLAFCRLAVEKHGGRIWVDNPDEGGARFNFTLPVASETQEMTEAQASSTG
jgi:signal transduction histidine kinase